MSTACVIVDSTQLLASAFEGGVHTNILRDSCLPASAFEVGMNVNSLHDDASLWLGLGNCTVS